jgi:hypothetical protein
MQEYLTLRQASRFWTRVDASGGPDACWPFVGRHNQCGYGVVRIGSVRTVQRGELAHRVAYVLTQGEFPPDRPFGLHTCDNPPCCNPSHIYAGTQADNNRDRAKRGRNGNLKGESNGQAVLSEEIVREARRRWAADRITATALAAEYGVALNTLLDAIRGRHWGHVK